MTKLGKLEILKDMLQMAVDRGATSVEQVHKIVADLPFDVLENTGLIDGTDNLNLREKNQQTIGRVYDSIREINQQIGDLANDLFEIAEDGQHASEQEDSSANQESTGA